MMSLKDIISVFGIICFSLAILISLSRSKKYGYLIRKIGRRLFPSGLIVTGADLNGIYRCDLCGAIANVDATNKDMTVIRCSRCGNTTTGRITSDYDSYNVIKQGIDPSAFDPHKPKE